MRFPGKRGFSLVELLIIVSIIIILILLIFINFRTQTMRARDAKRKADLNIISKSFEEYFNDAEEFPNEGSIDNCGTADFTPYLQLIPCDPKTKDPYLYVPITPLSSGYRVCAMLEDKKDPDITRIGCHPDNGCGYGAGYNYCLAVGAPVTPPDFNPFIPPTPTPTPTPHYEGSYACTPSGACNNYDDPADPKYGCPVSWLLGCPTEGSSAACNDPANRCRL